MVYWFFLLRGLECSFLDFSLDSELWVFSFFSQVSIHITLSSFSIGKSWFLGWFSWVQEEVLHFLVSWHLEILLLGLYCIFPFFFFFCPLSWPVKVLLQGLSYGISEGVWYVGLFSGGSTCEGFLYLLFLWGVFLNAQADWASQLL